MAASVGPVPRLALGERLALWVPEVAVDFAAGLGEGSTFIRADRHVDRSSTPFRIGKFVGRTNTVALGGSLLTGVTPGVVARIGRYHGKAGGPSVNVGLVNRSIAPRHQRRILMLDIKGWDWPGWHIHVYGTNAHIPATHVVGATVAAATMRGSTPMATPNWPTAVPMQAALETLGLEVAPHYDYDRMMCLPEYPSHDAPIEATYVDHLLHVAFP